jgi:predicted NBD/HSP70 family sugar kinase
VKWAHSLDYLEVPQRLVQPTQGNRDAQYAIGIRVTTDRLIGLLLDLDGRVVDLRLPTGRAYHEGQPSLRVDLDSTDIRTLVTAIASLTKDLLQARQDLTDRMFGLGVSIGGHVDGEAGIVRFSPDLGWAGEVPLAELIAQDTGFKVVVVENDVNVLVDAEQWSGTAGRYHRFAVVKIGSGIGCGLSLHRGLERGATGAAGELGHIPYPGQGRNCVCGKRGCLQTEASGSAILRTIRESGRQDVSAIDEAADHARGGDEFFKIAFERAGEALGTGLAVLLNLFNLEAVILCGDAALLKYEPYVEAARRSLDAHAFSTTAEDCQLLVEARTEELEARGAASMALGRLADVRHDA